MEFFVFSPGGDARYPGLILAQYIPIGHTGLENDEFTLATAARYAAAGYVVTVPFTVGWRRTLTLGTYAYDPAGDRWHTRAELEISEGSMPHAALAGDQLLLFNGLQVCLLAGLL